MPGPQQQQQDCPTGGDCPSLQALLTHGVCKEEFQAFDSCFDEAHAKGSNEDACTPLFEKFRACMKSKTSTVSNVVQKAMGN